MRCLLYFEYLDVFMEMFPGAMRGYGHSLPPAVISLLGVVGTRVLWVNLVFPKYRTFRGLVTVYPVTWVITAAALAAAYFHMKHVTMKDFFSQSNPA